MLDARNNVANLTNSVGMTENIQAVHGDDEAP